MVKYEAVVVDYERVAVDAQLISKMFFKASNKTPALENETDYFARVNMHTL